MPKGKGKKATPPKLDGLFARGVITEENYKEFWAEYWPASERERKEIIKRYIAELAEEEPERPVSGTITRNHAEAKRQAKAMGGYVARRNASGKFSKRGTYYQAIKRSRK